VSPVALQAPRPSAASSARWRLCMGVYWSARPFCRRPRCRWCESPSPRSRCRRGREDERTWTTPPGLNGRPFHSLLLRSTSSPILRGCTSGLFQRRCPGLMKTPSGQRSPTTSTAAKTTIAGTRTLRIRVLPFTAEQRGNARRVSLEFPIPYSQASQTNAPWRPE
jgi:hypothetical protein